jgi:hypothetical protein
LGNVLKLRVDKEILKAESNQESGKSVDILHKESRASTSDEKLATEVEIRLFNISLSLSSRLEEIINFLESIHHVGPLRNWPERVYFGKVENLHQ